MVEAELSCRPDRRKEVRISSWWGQKGFGARGQGQDPAFTTVDARVARALLDKKQGIVLTPNPAHQNLPSSLVSVHYTYYCLILHFDLGLLCCDFLSSP